MIRKIEPKDRESFIRFTKEFYSSDAVLHPIPDSYHTNIFDEMMHSNRYTEGFILESGSTPAGYALIAKTYSHECGGMVVWIEEIYVSPDFRGQGLGREFFDYLQKEYADSVCRFRLEVEPDNQQAVKLYKRLGFDKLNYNQMVKELS